MKNKLFVMRDNYIGLQQMIDYINTISNTKDMDMIEIGSYAGESTEFFSNNFKSVLSIDPYLNDYDKNDPTINYLDLNDVFNLFNNKIKDISNITHIRKLSDDAIDDLLDQKFDFVYIDGLHTYDQVKKDILNYKNIIKDTGFIAGHDYHKNWFGVVNAVNEILINPDKVFADYS